MDQPDDTAAGIAGCEEARWADTEKTPPPWARMPKYQDDGHSDVWAVAAEEKPAEYEARNQRLRTSQLGVGWMARFIH